MKVLRFLQSPADLPWIIISQLILALTVAHFGTAIYDDSKEAEMDIQDIQMPRESPVQDDGKMYILSMGDSPDECIVSTIEGHRVMQLPLSELDITSLDGRLVVDLSLSDEKQRFFAAVSQRHRDINMNMGIVTKRGGSR